MLMYKPKKSQNAVKGSKNRILICITVLGSAGPIRFVVNEEENVRAVIDMTLKSYAREGRLPILGSDLDSFLLYCPHTASDALDSGEKIGSLGTRNFMLCKKPQLKVTSTTSADSSAVVSRKGSGNWKSWINKSLSFKIPSH